ncbi:hypothetical protein EYF80_059783 [Liparis tanakae]|uniref:Uncharacterized protein n=1 Tax=Liparis tanakae TaxID=230148 RepID=A0A4Z2EM91_9TELE|nr:hypothetical protein EYF80_059783 [Liparis tanakae]
MCSASSRDGPPSASLTAARRCGATTPLRSLSTPQQQKRGRHSGPFQRAAQTSNGGSGLGAFSPEFTSWTDTAVLQYQAACHPHWLQGARLL